MIVLFVQGDIILECKVVEIEDSSITIANLSFYFYSRTVHEDKIRNKTIYLSV